MIIKVLQHHIDNGVKSTCVLCPISLSLKEQTGFEWWIAPSGAALNHPTTDRLEDDIPLPDIALDFMDDFDDEIPVVPFEFELPCEDILRKVENDL